MNGCVERGLARCTARANSSLPVPDWPSSSTVACDCDTRSNSDKACNKGGELPISPYRAACVLSACDKAALRARKCRVCSLTNCSMCSTCPAKVASTFSTAKSSFKCR